MATRWLLSQSLQERLAKSGFKTAYQGAAMSVIHVTVKPGSRESALEELEDGSFLAKLKSQPVDGKANAELIALLSKHFKVPKAAVVIKSGASARVKRVKISHS
jgi:hypothetical protein